MLAHRLCVRCAQPWPLYVVPGTAARRPVRPFHRGLPARLGKAASIFDTDDGDPVPHCDAPMCPKWTIFLKATGRLGLRGAVRPIENADAAMPKPRKVRQRVNPGLDARLGSLLRQRRQELGLSQSVLGKKLDLTFQQIQKYENGTNQLTVSRLLQISRVLNTPIDYFLASQAALYPYEPIDYRLIRVLNGIRNQQAKQVLLRLARCLR